MARLSPVIGGHIQDLPPPAFCPLCRLQRRLAFINQIIVYSRTSSVSGKRIFSMFPREVPFPVYENDEWWSDKWSAMDFGKDIDWSRGFFAQHEALQRVVPHFALMVLQNEDCDYCNNASQNKHCYLCFNTRRSEDCLCCERAVACTNCLDCSEIASCEHCFRCISCSKSHTLQDSQECTDCSDSFFLLNCRSCRNCFGCVNLRHAEFRVFNEQYTKEKYEQFLRDFNLASHGQREKWREKAVAFWQTQPRPDAVMTMVENVSGNYLFQCKNVRDSYFVRDGEDLRYCSLAFDGVKNCCDYTTYGDQVELVYESARCGNRFTRCAFCYYCYDGCNGLLYCSYCVSCQDCFGCVGLRKKRFCIFNKQYSTEEYAMLVPKLIAHMRSTKEWGEFFPIASSPNPYNHTLAQRYFPLTNEQVAAKALQWYAQDIPVSGSAIEASRLPDVADKRAESLVVKSETSGKPFSITPQEIKCHAAMRAPLPRTTYVERMEERAKALGGMSLYERKSAKTGKTIRTVIAPDTPWVVWEKDEYEKEFSS